MDRLFFFRWNNESFSHCKPYNLSHDIKLGLAIDIFISRSILNLDSMGSRVKCFIFNFNWRKADFFHRFLSIFEIFEGFLFSWWNKKNFSVNVWTWIPWDQEWSASFSFLIEEKRIFFIDFWVFWRFSKCFPFFTVAHECIDLFFFIEKESEVLSIVTCRYGVFSTPNSDRMPHEFHGLCKLKKSQFFLPEITWKIPLKWLAFVKMEKPSKISGEVVS